MDKTTLNNADIIYDNEIVIGEVEMYLGKKVEVYVSSRNGMKYLRLRAYRQDAKTKEWFPSPKEGINIPFMYTKPSEDYQTAQLLSDMIVEALQRGKDMPLFDPEGMVVKKKR